MYIFCLIMRNFYDKNCRENQNTHFVFNNFFPRKSCRLWDNVEKYCRAGQATDDNMAHAHCKGYTHTLRIRSTYYFSAAKKVTRTHLDATFIHTLHVLSKIACCRRPPWRRYTHTAVLRASNSEQLATIEHHILSRLPSSYHDTPHSWHRKENQLILCSHVWCHQAPFLWGGGGLYRWLLPPMQPAANIFG